MVPQTLMVLLKVQLKGFKMKRQVLYTYVHCLAHTCSFNKVFSLLLNMLVKEALDLTMELGKFIDLST